MNPRTDTAGPPGQGGSLLPGTLPGAAVAAAAWACYLPLGIQYLAYLGGVAAALAALARQDRLGTLARHPLTLALAAFWAWSALTTLWTPAPLSEIVPHLWSYALPLGVLPLAMALRPADADRAIGHFVMASALLGLGIALGATGLLGAPDSHRPWLDVSGNQRITHSVLLALGTALAAWRVLDQPGRRARAAWILLGLACLAGLLLQDRRTGLLALPLLLLVLALCRRRAGGGGGAPLLAVLTLAAMVLGAATPSVQQRFAEGFAELRAYQPTEEVSSSWGMRARLAQETVAMIAERPLAGYGIGSWPVLWPQRVKGPDLLRRHSTPHSELLLVAAQAGLVGTLLLGAAILSAWMTLGRPAGRREGILLVLVLLLWTGLSNAVLRDAKFALPLLGLAALTAAVGRQGER